MIEPSPERAANLEVTVTWPAYTTQNAQPANQFVVMQGPDLSNGSPDNVYLVLGHFLPPIALDPNDMTRILGELNGSLPVTPLGVFSMTPGRLAELRDTITRHLDGLESSMFLRGEDAQGA